MKKLAVGGQAVIEGVLMKSPHYFSIAVRKPDNTISLAIERHDSISQTHRLLSLPFLRGIVAMAEMLFLGIKALNYSASVVMDNNSFNAGNKATETKGRPKKENKRENKKENKRENQKRSKKFIEYALMFFSFVFAVVFAVLLFKAMPLAIVNYLRNKGVISGTIAFNALDGAIRVSFFVLYIYLISLLKDVQRIFQYHGAEHKAIHCYESGKKLTVKNAMQFTTLHKRCGTSFLMFVLIVSIAVFSIVPITLPFFAQLLYRLMLLLPIASLSYEFLKLSYKLGKSRLFSALSFPGLMLQKITTREPEKEQLETAIAALKAVLAKEKTLSN